jgi:O-succinylbenzoic acid--CoA ligase
VSGPHLPNWLARRAELMPEQLAILTGEEQLSFAALNERVNEMARRLAALDIRAGDRVAVLLRNSTRFVEIVHAVTRIGAVLVPLNMRLTVSELAWQLADVQAKLLIFDQANAAPAEHAAAGLTHLRLVSTDALTGAVEQAATRPNEQIDLASVHCIIYTSGTTGRPKGAMLTYGNHWWSAIGSALNLGNHEDDRWLAVLPLYHVGGLSILMRSVVYGIPAIVHESFDPVQVNRAIDEDGVTIVSVVSVMLQRMLEEHGVRPYPSSLRCVLLGGGPAHRPLLEACAARGVPVVQTYGLTETASQAVTLAPGDALRKLGSAGKPLMPNELRIERDGVAAPAGAVGEIMVRGPTVTAGYVNRPDETAAAIRDGWLHTGDLGYLDPDGYLYVLDRRDDLIVSGGENVYPAEVESVLLAHPAVEDAGVVGVPDERWGQAPVAVVTLRPGATVTAAALLAFCTERLAHYKLPVRIWRADRLPRNTAGKLQRNLLRGALSGDGEQTLDGALRFSPLPGRGSG